MTLFKTIALCLFATHIAHAANSVSDGTFAGTGTWSTTSAAGTMGGVLEQTWTQHGEDAHNVGLLKLQGQTVQSFDDAYKFIALQGVNYKMQRLISGQYVDVGGCTQSASGYACHIDQATPAGNLTVTESGFMQDQNTLLRIGTLTTPDGTVTTYSSTLIRQ